MVPLSWNNFLRQLLHFVVVNFNQCERLVRLRLLSFELSWIGWIEIGLSSSMVERGKRKTQKGITRLCLFHPTEMLVVVVWMLVLSLLAELLVWPSF
jgi:hypothetical protein